MIAAIKYLTAPMLLNTGTSTLSLPINPIKLILFVGWLYLCLYCVYRVQFSEHVPIKFRTTACVFAIFLGPLLLFFFTVADIIRKASEGQHGIVDIIKQKLSNLRTKRVAKSNSKPVITLLDASGRRLDEIYKGGKGRHQNNHILDLTEQIIANALDDRSSDILIDPKDSLEYTIRYRVDGVLREAYQIKSDICKAVINSIKAISSMDIAERRRPQDGSFTAEREDSTHAFRVASAGVYNGEKLVIRVLNQDSGMFTLDKLGLSEKQRSVIEASIKKPQGMILMCGPTGSGKTTTLYAMMNEIDLKTRNVITIEDPIEYVLPQASQIEVNTKAGITFAKSLRSILRQDPDVICVGEIRDTETAGTALQAAQTGHLVFATIHSNNNATSLIRLLDLKVSPLLLSSGLNLLISQRLVRRLCKNCKETAELSSSQIHRFRNKKINYTNFKQAKGCYRCDGTGYYGRIAIYDMLLLDSKLKAAIANNKLSIDHLRNEGDQRGRSNLQKQGLKLVTLGITSLDELKRIIG